MSTTTRRLRRVGTAVAAAWVGSAIAVGPALGATRDGGGSGGTDLVFATSEIAQVMLSIAAVSFAVLAARAYGGEIGKAIYVAAGGVIVFSSWQLLKGASQLLDLQAPPATVGSTVNLLVTVLLLAGFYMLYETISGVNAG
jgi:hypothetical protein